ncbi:MAG: tRNA (adenosine(37)-N6)-threonylcarbamoyltransferase complex ATPase subunit type 1 TsaE [Bacteroidales bacterium]
MKHIEVKSLDALENAAKQILEEFPHQRIFALYGKMGAGKTTLIRTLCKLLEVEEEVNSPTFALINEYYSPSAQSIYHFDFYRIESLEEVFDIGYEDYFYSGNYCFLEWPERITELLPKNYVYLQIEITGPKQRKISYQSVPEFR